MTHPQDAAFPTFTEHRIRRDRGNLYVRDFPGNGPAFVLLHRFPDNAHIYDDLIPHLVSTGRRTVAIDFLGFGASDKPGGCAVQLRPAARRSGGGGRGLGARQDHSRGS